jgi:dynein heavy chain
VASHWKEWKAWRNSEDPYAAKMPGDYSKKLTDFDKLIMIKCLRYELLQQAMAEYVIRDMGQFYVESPSVSMDIIYEDISTITPLIFVLSQGADPNSQLVKFAMERGFQNKLFQISLGQGQGPKAEAQIQQACRDGNWVMLQNCHLGRTWMPQLEKIVLNFAEDKDNIHEDFRLFLTSMPADYFPVSVLQNSVKLTTEPPRGLRANLKRTYGGMSQEYIDNCQKPQIWRKLLFSFSFFHAVIQERRKFGPLGWNIRYEFNDSDLETSFTMLKLFLDSPEPIPWDALLFVTGHINYGGRVTDDLDRRCLLTILEKYCIADVLKNGYKFTPSGLYFAPEDGKVEIYRDYIEKLPLNDPPEVFGLHENANINYNEQESSRVVETILSIQPRLAGGAGGMTPDQVVLEKAKEILDELP